MTTALITGANGFIGRNLITRLLKEEVRIYAVVLPEESVSDCLLSKKVTIIRGNLENSHLDASLFPERIDAMYHFAWIGVNPESRKSFEIQHRNITLLVNVLNLVKNLNVAKFILPGSTNEYLYSGGLSRKFKFEPENFDYSVAEADGGLMLTLKAKKGKKGIKEIHALVERNTYNPINLRIKVAFIWTTVKISNFHSGGITDEMLRFPKEKFSKYKFVDKR